MKTPILAGILTLGFAAVAAAQPVLAADSAPLYRVTVIQRTIKAVNYQYRTEPTEIDFAGTVLLPPAKGHAWVESKQGRTEIDANLERMAPSQRYGREYLTYVLWAISPEGRAHNLGELILSGSGKTHLRVTTDLQAFAMMVTAEPYSAVRTPSDVVVMENEIRPDTAGRIETVNASYELLPRGQYTWQVSDKLNEEIANAPKVSPSEYEALIELYQAENAIGIARESGAAQYAPNTFSKAEQLLASARDWNRQKRGDRHVVEFAKEATQTAEDARTIARQRQQEERVSAANAVAAAREAKAQSEVASAVADKQRAEAEAQQARYDAQSALQRAEAERQARERAEANAATARAFATPNQAPVANQAADAPSPASHAANNEATRDVRIRVYEALNKNLAVRDTPRGIIVTIPGTAFAGEILNATEQAVRVGVILSRFPGLQASCEGYTSEDNSEALSRQRANAVRTVLIESGLPAVSVSVTGFGNTRPLGPNNSVEGRAANSRVDIVVTGESIGTLPFWERTYRLDSRR